jgi:SAM-dependent methyltransferase
VYLVGRGWDAIGIDFSPKAIALARDRARRAQVHGAHFILADAARPPDLGAPFKLVLDIGCLHSIPKVARESYANVVKHALRDGGTYLLYSFCPPDVFGVARDEVETLFAPELRLESFVEGTGRPSAWYRFSRIGR